MNASNRSIPRQGKTYNKPESGKLPANSTPEGADRPPDVWRLDPTAQRLELLALGYRPIPLAGGAKTPPKAFPLADYLSGAPITPDVIETWARRWPEATNTGLLCGGDLLVIDADNAAIVRYLDTIGLPMTPVVETSRGRHYYFKRPAWLTTSQTGEGAPLPGLDAKATGYVVAPGSLHPSGAEYRALVPLDTPLNELPAWLTDMLRRNTSPAPTTPLAQTASTTDTAGLVGAIEAALGVAQFNAAGFSNNVPCPFHDDHHASATWTRANGGQLFCHAGCTPAARHVSRSKRSFGVIDTATALGIPLPNHSAPALAGLGRTPNGGGVVVVLKPEAPLSRSFVPLVLNLFTQPDKTARNSKGRPAKVYYMRDVADLAARAAYETGCQPHYRVLHAGEVADKARYKALAYATLTPGRARRDVLAAKVGVSTRTARRYDKLAGQTVTPTITRQAYSDRDAEKLPAKRKDAPPNAWLESTDGCKHVPTRDGLKVALKASLDHDGRALAWYCRQGMNHYTPPERDTAPIGLPVEFRRLLIREGYTNLARLLDALLLHGAQHGDEFTRAELIAIAARYGLSESTVRRVLTEVNERGQHVDLSAAPEATPWRQPPEVAHDRTAPGESVDHMPAQLGLGEGGRAGPVCVDCGRPATEHKLTGWYCAEHAPGADQLVRVKKRGAA